MCRAIKILPLLCLVSVIGCASHTPQVEIPSSGSDVVGWRMYYKDQFKAFGKDVPQPDADAPAAKRVAYEEEKDSYESSGKWKLVFGVLIFVIGLSAFLSTVSQL